jgi:DnaJ-class molecular chaperone
MNPYKILGVDKYASDKDIKKAYRRLAIKEHPDKGGNADTFKEINNAYETLSNHDKKQQYDTFGSCDNTTSQAPDPMSIFERFFGPGGPETFHQDPGNVTTNMFSGFTQSDSFNGLNMFLGGIGGNMTSFSQTTVFQDGIKITTTTRNGQTTVHKEFVDTSPALR